MGRTGKLFAYEYYNFEPDMVTLAKGLGSGFPIGAMLAKKEVAQHFTPGTHGSTFGGNPTRCHSWSGNGQRISWNECATFSTRDEFHS